MTAVSEGARACPTNVTLPRAGAMIVGSLESSRCRAPLWCWCLPGEGRDAISIARGQPALGGPDRRRRRQAVPLALERSDELGEGRLLGAGHDAEILRRVPQQADALLHRSPLRRLGYAHFTGGHGKVFTGGIVEPTLATARGFRVAFVGTLPDGGDLFATRRGSAGQVGDGAHLALELLQPRQLAVDLIQRLLELPDLRATLDRLGAQPVELAVVTRTRT